MITYFAKEMKCEKNIFEEEKKIWNLRRKTYFEKEKHISKKK